MAHLIDKDALVAEIERLRDDAHNGVSYHQSRQNVGLNNELSTWEHLESAFATILKIIDTLEVKEVDLEHEVESYWKQCDMTWCRDAYSMTHIRSMLSDIAKYFFELGMQVSNKAQKGEEV